MNRLDAIRRRVEWATERLTEIQERLARFQEWLTPDDCDPAQAVLHYCGDVEFLLAENAALLARAEQAERERDARRERKVVAEQLTQEVVQLEAERDALRAEAGRLREALQLLHDEQNGPPLVRREAQWGAAMTKAYNALASTPLSASYPERMRAMERVAEAAKELDDLDKSRGPYPYDTVSPDRWLAAEKKLRDALAALDVMKT